MKSSDVSAEDRLQILRLFISGKDPRQVAEGLGRTAIEVRDIAHMHGYPSNESMWKAAIVLDRQVHPTPAGKTQQSAPRCALDELLDDAVEHPLAKIRNRAATLRRSLDQLAEEVEAERATREKAEEVQRIMEQLEKAREELREARGVKSPQAVDATETVKVRAWAAENGHQVSARGRIPAKLLVAYRQAHQVEPEPAK